MDAFEQSLEQSMRETAGAAPRAGAPDEILAGVRTGRIRRRRNHLIGTSLAGAATMAAVIAVLNAVGVLGGVSIEAVDAPPVASGADGGNGIGVVAPGEPCPGALHAPPEELARAADQQIWLPAEGSGPAVTDAWACGQGQTPIVLFGKVQASYETGWADVDVKEKWASLAQQDGGYITTISGVSTLVHPSTDIAPNNQILMVVDGTLVRLLAESGVPIDELVSLANSLDFDHAVR